MITEMTGDILRSRAAAVVCPVNTGGVMGAGLALAMKREYRGLEGSYESACRRGELMIGTVHTFARRWDDAGEQIHQPRYVICVPTKENWRQPSRLNHVYKGLRALRAELEFLHLPSCAVPALGCDLGALDWPKVRELAIATLTSPSVEIHLYPPLPSIGDPR